MTTLVIKSLYSTHIMHPESSKMSYEHSIRNAQWQYQVSAARGTEFVIAEISSIDIWNFQS